MPQEALTLHFLGDDGSTSEDYSNIDTGPYLHGQPELHSDSAYRSGGSSTSFHNAIEQSLSFPSTSALSSSPSPVTESFPSGTEEQKRRPHKASQKIHQCEVCSKEFSRPSGLRTHMNMHSHAQPYKCPFPACPKSFSVLSNARRHYRTHGEEPPSSLPQYQVNFDVPVTAPQTAPPPPLSLSQAPFRVRWVGPNLRTRTHRAQPPDIDTDACDDDRSVSDDDHDTNFQCSPLLEHQSPTLYPLDGPDDTPASGALYMSPFERELFRTTYCVDFDWEMHQQ